MKKAPLILVGLALAVWGATRLFQAELLRERVQRSLERSLNRRVEINGRLDYKWLTGPGLEVNDVVIHEDPALGLEPIAYVGALEATPRWLSLLRGRLAFSTLRLIEPSLNLKRTPSGALNVQPFLEGLFSARGEAEDLPEIQVRDGRVNFAEGRRKHVFYLTSTDIDLFPVDASRFNLRITTEAARTDRPPVSYGSFSAQGGLRLLPQSAPEIDLTLDLDRNALADVLLLFEGRRVDLSGRISARTKIAGPLTDLKIDGRLDLEGFQRWSIPGIKPGAVTLYFTGYADLPRQSVKIGSVMDSKAGLPVDLRFRAERVFSAPRWGLVVTARELPVAVFADISRATGIPLPEKFPPAGSGEGGVGLSSAQPRPAGGFLIAVPDAKPYRFELTSAGTTAPIATFPARR
ncbi:MAG: AsmA family protein [Bryobacteraceae bacterium]|nr:AsmA family protein [Bryobacteraceae bacterium]